MIISSKRSAKPFKAGSRIYMLAPNNGKPLKIVKQRSGKTKEVLQVARQGYLL